MFMVHQVNNYFFLFIFSNLIGIYFLWKQMNGAVIGGSVSFKSYPTDKVYY